MATSRLFCCVDFRANKGEHLTTLLQSIRELIAAPAEALGYRIVQLKFNETSRNRTLQVMAERISDSGMNIDDCEKLSRTISALLDVNDTIANAYRLEVSSPGIDRPLTRIEEYTEYKGFTAKIETHLPVNGRKRYSGTLMGVDGDVVRIDVDGTEYSIRFADIYTAKLVLTDALIKAHQQRYAT